MASRSDGTAEFDFSHVNLEYLIQARDLVRHNPRTGALLLGLSDELTQGLANLTPEGLALVTRFKLPLVSLRLADWWWERLFRAMHDGDLLELQIILEHVGLLTDR